MLRFLLDTDHLTLLEYGHATLLRRILAQPPNSTGVSVVTVEEALRGRLAALSKATTAAARIARYDYLIRTVESLSQFALIPFNLSCESRYQQLRSLRLRIGSQDLRIASIALVNNATLLTRNRGDFGQVPGLVLDDWSV